MKNLLIAIAVIIVVLVGYVLMRTSTEEAEPQVIESDTDEVTAPEESEGEQVGDVVAVSPISHATAVLEWGDNVIYTDPATDPATFEGMPAPDIIVVTDIHGDHLNVETLDSVTATDTVIIAPQAVADEFTETLLGQTVVLANGEMTTEKGIAIEAIPMYNLPESAESRHTKGRGNGYVLEQDGYRVYIAGDTADIPEMRALTDINLAFVPMNLPFTMDVDTAADAVLDFAPRTVYPFHYRGEDGLADIGRFKELVNTGNPEIEVVLLDWYPEM